MAIDRITNAEITAARMASVTGSKLTGTVAENKARFDELGNLTVAKLNEVIDALNNYVAGTIVLAQATLTAFVNIGWEYE